MRDPGLTSDKIQHYAEALTVVWRLAIVAIVLTGIAMLFSAPASAQTTPSMTFGASVSTADGALSTRLTWASTPAASSCTASGHPSWTGTKAASGTLDLPAITLSGTYALTLACNWPGDTSAKLTWTPPTQNTDGTPLTNLAGYRLAWGLSQTNLTGSQQIANPAATTYTVTGLAAGTWSFAARAYNANNVESARTPFVTKTITAASQTRNASVTLTVNPIPAVPAGMAVE